MDSNNKCKNESIVIWLLTFIQIFHILDFVILMPLGPALMREFEINPTQFAALVSSYNFSAAIIGFIFGIVADKYIRKNLVIISSILFIIATIACAIAESYEFLLAARILSGGFGGILNVLVYSIVTDLIPFERRGNAMGTILSAFSITSVLGVPFGLLLADIWGWRSSFIFIVIFSLIVTILVCLFLPGVETTHPKKSIIKSIINIFKIALHKEYFISYFLVFILASSAFLIIPFLSPYAVKNLGILESELKYIYLVGGFFTVISSRIIGRLSDRFGSLSLFNFLIIFSLIPIYLYTHLTEMSFPLFIFISTLFMVSVSGRFIPAMTQISSLPVEEERGAYMSVFNALRSLFGALATLVAGMIITEDSQGHLIGFNKAGVLSILLSLMGIFIFYKLSSISEKLCDLRSKT